MMVKKLNRLLILPFLIVSFLYYGNALGFDTELYTITGLEVPPNVLIILDNSSSMLTEDQPPDYNPNLPNLPPEYPGPYNSNQVFSKQGSNWVLFWNDVETINCPDTKDKLKTYGTWNGKIKSDTNCGGSKTQFLQTGNYMNYLVWTTTSNQPRLGLATGTIHSYINTTDGIRWGLMVFNANGQGGRVTAPISDDKQQIFQALNDIQPPTVVDWTPLAESLYEGMLHFKGGQSYYNFPTTYGDPIQYYCQKNYVILITDGAPTHDVADDSTSPISVPNVNPQYPFIGDYDKDGNEPGTYGDPLLFGSHYLDDVAKYMHETDMSSTLKGRQNVTVYTIGFNPSQFAIDSTLLQSTADKGGGKYFYCHNAQSFKIALQLIIEDVLSDSTSFVAPTVPISQMVRTASDNRMYLGMFKPTENSFWKGNIKKFGIAQAKDPSKGIVVGDILDKNNNLAIDPALYKIYDTASTYWSSGEDGGDVEKGGVGYILKNMSDLSKRNIYTYLGTNSDLTDSSNKFIAGTSSPISPSLLGLSTDEERDKLVNFLYGYDSYDEDMNPGTDKRSWILGAILHSRPLVIRYSSRSIIFAGANDGMLHAFYEDTGEELWAFIPPDMLPKLKNLTGNTVEFFVDGTPRAFIDPNSSTVILICGERRGGNRYFALDVSNPTKPQWKWEIRPEMPDFAEMGQTWSTPYIGKINDVTGDKWAFFIGGGYDDTNQDNLPATKDKVTGGDAKGFAVYVVDVLTGGKIWKYSKADNARMKYSIPSDVGRVDTNGDGRIDRLYVGDMGGQMWRFDIGDPSPSNWTGKCIFDANDPPPSAGVDLRKIFYPPDISLEKDNGGNYELLIFGTGDREHPKSTVPFDELYYDRLYTLKDRNTGSVLKETNLVDVTDDFLQTGTDAQKQSISNALKSASGWYIKLDQNRGEKCLAPPLIFFGVSYFTTFTPFTGVVTDPCYLGEGDARLYAMSYLNGNAVFNFDSTTIELTRSDRSEIIGTAIPSGAIIAIIGGTSPSSYIGVGGGIFKTPLKGNKVLIPVNWKQKY
jgi:type IV pilus assembly protein PilY1